MLTRNDLNTLLELVVAEIESLMTCDTDDTEPALKRMEHLRVKLENAVDEVTL